MLSRQQSTAAQLLKSERTHTSAEQAGTNDNSLRKRLLATVAFAGKGGSGKSTACINLAVAAQRAGFQVKIIDADLQKSTLAWRKAGGRSDITVVSCQPEQISAAIDAAKRDGTEILFIDMPPDLRQVLRVAHFANLVILPTRPMFFDVAVTRKLADLLTASRKPYGVIINGAPPFRNGQAAPSVRSTREAFSRFEKRLWAGQITHRLAIPYATMRGLAVFEDEPESPAAIEFIGLWRTIVNTLNLRR